MEIPPGSVGMYPLDYDTCSRFRNGQECTLGTGISGSRCFYDYSDKNCKAEYTLHQKPKTIQISKKPSFKKKPILVKDNTNVEKINIEPQLKQDEDFLKFVTLQNKILEEKGFKARPSTFWAKKFKKNKSENEFGRRNKY